VTRVDDLKRAGAVAAGVSPQPLALTRLRHVPGLRVVALQIWTFSSAVAIFFGVAIAAELEAVRSGTQAPSHG
jgi:hypothetical protein